MRNPKTEKTSVFKGISFRRGKWYAQHKKSGFHQEFDDEMEALAHFMAVFCRSGTESNEAIASRAIFNSPDKGRMPLDSYRPILADTTYQLAIDKTHLVRLNEKSYESYKDFYWFMKFGRATSIKDVRKIDKAPWFEFTYQFLDEMIFRDKVAQVRGAVYEMNGANITRLNGDPFDLRMVNLDEPPQGEASRHVGFSPLIPIKRKRPDLKSIHPDLDGPDNGAGDERL